MFYFVEINLNAFFAFHYFYINNGVARVVISTYKIERLCNTLYEHLFMDYH